MPKMVEVDSLLAILQQSGISVSDSLKNLIEDKSFEQRSSNPPKVIDGVTYYYCRYTARYYPIDEMVVSNGKSKGYSKIGISAWTKVNAAIKKLDSQIADCVISESIEKAKKLNEQRQMLKEALNDPYTYSNIVDGKVQLSII